jgi:hypothetical protein
MKKYIVKLSKDERAINTFGQYYLYGAGGV